MIRFIVLLTALLMFTNGASAQPSTKPELSGSYQIRSKKFGELLRPKDASNANGADIVLYPAEPWKCMTWKVESTESGFQLRNHFTSKTFASTAPTNGAAVIQVPYGQPSETRPTWQLTELEDGTFKIIDPKTGNALTAVKDHGFKITIAPWQSKEEQKWELLPIDPSQLTM